MKIGLHLKLKMGILRHQRQWNTRDNETSGSTENKITKDKNGENVPHLEITEVVLVHCNIVNNDYQQDSRLLYTLVPNKPFRSLLEISTTNHILLKILNSEFQEIIVWFTDQHGQPEDVEDNKFVITMVLK